MAGHSRLKDGVASARLRPAIHVFLAKVKQERGCPAPVSAKAPTRPRVTGSPKL